MIKSYLKIAVRNLYRHKLFSLINIFGLALSMSVGLMAIVGLREQLSYDRFHPHPDRLYRVNSLATNGDGKQWNLASTPLPLKESLAADSSLVAGTVRLYPALQGKISYGRNTVSLNGAFTEPSFFRLFGFTLAVGNAHSSLALPNSIVLSKATAARLFGNAPPLGKMVTVAGLGIYQVTGILQDSPGKTLIAYDALASSATVPQLEKQHQLPARLSNWNSFNDAYTYVLLQSNATKAALENLLARQAALNSYSKQGSLTFSAQPVSRITPSFGDVANEMHGATTWGKALAVPGIAFIILLSACFNYTNLSIARSLSRAKEVGIRRTAGAMRYQIFMQYVTEAVIVSLLSLVLSVLILLWMRDSAAFNADWEFVPRLSVDMPLLLALLFFGLFTGVLAGGLPAWVMASFRPAGILRGMVQAKLWGGVHLRKSLIVFQFATSLIIIIFLWAFYRQFSHMSAADPGFRKEQVLAVSLQGADPELLAGEISRLSGVESIAPVSGSFGHRATGSAAVVQHKGDQPVHFNYYYTGPDILFTMQLTLLAGRPLAEEREQASSVLLNETAVKALNFKSNEAAIGESIWINDSSRLQVSGVVKDFHYESMAVPVRPLVLRTGKAYYSYLDVSIRGNKAQCLQQVQDIWKKVQPSQPFTAYWLDEEMHSRYAQRSAITAMGYLSFISVFIAALGLLALVTYSVETRRKELGIRKVMGAGVGLLALLLTRGFLKLLMIAAAIAVPAGYLLGALFLQNFAYRAPFGIGNALLCTLLLWAVALVAIVPQVLRAALSNPIKALRTE
ncbi:ABC transporter permease [Chitinophaga japonensis]|uniref:Putative ABC transport system permease protein n=1 Tax=Chitinophaga japonensis TaxID=104662 RepID=A0A562TFT2_CHIJA|nr:ABC transporter permease [Chitinophaga japonensis]TWI91946.1 putative ABC transport system permease protein [Chitinophaga japonensis]